MSNEVINTYCPGIPSQDKGCCFMAVLTRFVSQFDPDHIEEAVYIGIVKLPWVVPDDGPEREAYDQARKEAADWVARTGAKQSYKKALAFFPSLKEEHYRA
jgi:hypothetical protein